MICLNVPQIFILDLRKICCKISLVAITRFLGGAFVQDLYGWGKKFLKDRALGCLFK